MPLFAAENYFLYIAQILQYARYILRINRLVRFKKRGQLNRRIAENQECPIDPSKLEQPRILLMKLHINFESNSLIVNVTYVTWSPSTNLWERLRRHHYRPGCAPLARTRALFVPHPQPRDK